MIATTLKNLRNKAVTRSHSLASAGDKKVDSARCQRNQGLLGCQLSGTRQEHAITRGSSQASQQLHAEVIKLEEAKKAGEKGFGGLRVLVLGGM